MFIETEGTPNPATLKFLPGQDVMGLSTADFASATSAERSPLATALFALPGVARVFLGGDFITVTKSDVTDWSELKPLVLGAIMDHFTSGAAVIESGADSDGEEMGADVSDEIVSQITLSVDGPVALPVDSLDGVNVVILKSVGGKVIARFTSADGTAQAVPVDSFLALTSANTDITAISVERVPATPTVVKYFLGQKA